MAGIIALHVSIIYAPPYPATHTSRKPFLSPQTQTRNFAVRSSLCIVTSANLNDKEAKSKSFLCVSQELLFFACRRGVMSSKVSLSASENCFLNINLSLCAIHNCVTSLTSWNFSSLSLYGFQPHPALGSAELHNQTMEAWKSFPHSAPQRAKTNKKIFHSKGNFYFQ